MDEMDRRAFLARSSVMVAAGAAALSPSAAQARPAPASFSAIDAALAGAVADGTVLGVAAMAATEDGIVYDGTAGRAQVETGAAMRDDSVFWLLSMTKAFTATAAMQLIELGRMRLDQPAAEILPELANPQILEGFDAAGQPVLRPARRAITVRHLLTHTAGYTYSIWSEAITRCCATAGTRRTTRPRSPPRSSMAPSSAARGMAASPAPRGSTTRKPPRSR